MQLAVIDDALYHSLMTIHVLMAVAWIGGGLMITLQAERSRQAHDEAELVKTAISADFWATRVFIPSAVVLFLCGVGMVIDGHIGFGRPFVDIGLVGWLVSMGLGSGFLAPQGKKVGQLLDAGGGTVDAAIVQRVERILWVARVDLVILLFVIVNMVVKPGGFPS